MSHGHSSDPKRMQARREVWHTAACPKCGAQPGNRCVGTRGKTRYASHKERWDAFKQV